MVSVTSASRYITSASCDNPLFQSRSSMYICGLIPRNFAESAEKVPIESTCTTCNALYIHPSHDSILELWQTFPNVKILCLLSIFHAYLSSADVFFLFSKSSFFQKMCSGIP